jgi:hypothetical protein
MDERCAADIWEVGEILEMVVTIGEIIASNAFGNAVFVVVPVRPRDIEEENGMGQRGVLGVLSIGIRGAV